MSAPVDKLWPKEGNIFKTKADVLLVCQLAALKAGFSHLEIRSDYPSGRVDSCAIRCAAEFNGKRCLLLLVMLEMVDRGDLKLGWRITTVRADNLEAARHPNHIGQSESLSVSSILSWRAETGADTPRRSYHAQHSR